MKAIEVYRQQNGDVTKAYYAELSKLGRGVEIPPASTRGLFDEGVA
jgi:hypothetical protein